MPDILNFDDLTGDAAAATPRQALNFDDIAPEGARPPLSVTVSPSNGDAPRLDAPEAAAAPATAPPANPKGSLSSAVNASEAADANAKVNAFTGGFVRDIPIIGPALDSGAKAAAAGVRSVIHGTPYADERKAVEDYANKAKEEHPVLDTAGGITGNVVAMAPVGMTAAGARALGIEGGTLPARMAFGAGGNAIINAADAKVRGEDALPAAGYGALAGAIAPAAASVVRRAITPLTASPERQALTQVLDREGVNLTAGDRTGSKPLRWMESTLGDMPGAGGASTAIKDRQGNQFTRAALSRAGINAELATPDVIQTGATRLGQEFDRLSSAHTLRYDPPFARSLGRMLREYENVMPSQQREVVNNVLQDIVNQGGGMSGESYQALRSQLSRQAHAIRQSDPMLSGALGGIRDALDEAMGRSISGPDAAAWGLARRQWGNLRTIEKAMSGAGEKTAEGFISPQQLRAATSARNRSAYARGLGDLTELSRAGEGVLKPLPNSGTAPRAYMQYLAMAGLGAGGYAATGDPTYAAAGFFTPALLARALLSRPAQAYLGNQVAGRGVERAVTRALQGPGREAVRKKSEREVAQ